MLEFNEALTRLIQEHAPPSTVEQVALEQAEGRILAQDVQVQYDMPLFDNSAMDGYAIHGNDCGQWKVVARIIAGDRGQEITLQEGEAARIFTGAPTPIGTTAVIMQEDAQMQDQLLTCSRAEIQPWLNIRRQAEELKLGATLLAQHTCLTPATVGLLASQGITSVACYPRVKVLVFSSGNELIQPGTPLQPGKIYDSNRFMLRSWLQRLSCEVLDGGILPDHAPTIRKNLLEAAQQADIILCSGGVSVGEEDHLKDALAEIGELIQWKLNIKPGKPLAWGRVKHARVFLLPGNPVSSFATFRQLVLPAIKRLAGAAEAEAYPVHFLAKADFSWNKTHGRREFLRGKLHHAESECFIQPLAMQGSAMLSACAQADALIEIPPHSVIQPGQLVTVYPLS